MARKSREEWRTLVAEFESSGETPAAFGERHGVRPSTLAWWRSEFKRATSDEGERPAEPPAVETVPRRSSSSKSVPSGVEVQFGDIIVRFPPGVSAEFIGAVVLELKVLG